MTQTKEIIQKYEKVFHNSLHYGFVNRNQIEFYQDQFDVIRPSIAATLEFVDDYDFRDEQENIRIYAVACLPFMVAKFDIENPDTYYEVCGDAAYIFPFTEMCGNDRSAFIPEVLYAYRDDLPTNDHRQKYDRAVKYGTYIRSLPKYKKI